MQEYSIETSSIPCLLILCSNSQAISNHHIDCVENACWCLHWGQINGLVQDWSISIATALEILQFCTKPSFCEELYKMLNIILKKFRRFHTFHIDQCDGKWTSQLPCWPSISWMISIIGKAQSYIELGPVFLSFVAKPAHWISHRGWGTHVCMYQ